MTYDVWCQVGAGARQELRRRPGNHRRNEAMREARRLFETKLYERVEVRDERGEPELVLDKHARIVAIE